MNCRFFVCDDCKQYIDAGYRWAYWLLEHPEVVRLGEPVDTQAVFETSGYWQPPPEDRSAWLIDEILPAVREFLLVHKAHSLRYVESEHLDDKTDYVELPTSRNAQPERAVNRVWKLTKRDLYGAQRGKTPAPEGVGLRLGNPVKRRWLRDTGTGKGIWLRATGGVVTANRTE